MDIIRPLTEAQFEHAITNTARYFAEPISTSLHRIVPGNYGVLDVLRWTIQDFLHWTVHDSMDPTLNQAPPSMARFLCFVKPIFSTAFLREIDAQAREFDKRAGINGLSDIFIEARPAMESVKDLLRSITIHCTNGVIEAGQTQVGQTLGQSGKQQQPHEMGQVKSSPTSSKLPSHLPTTALSDTGSSPSRGCPVVQIHLEGPTILEAWKNNEITREIENVASSVGPPATQSFREFGTLPVYHGTDCFRTAGRFEREAALRTGALLGQSTGGCQVVPHVESLPVIWTGFGPLRCFLWAAFGTEVLSPVPTRKAKGKLLSPVPTGKAKGKLEGVWPCGGHTHNGITLLKFRPTLPVPFGLSAYVLPEGREEEWDDIRSRNTGHLPYEVERMGPEKSVKYMWDLFSDIHGGATNSWPHAFHCREFGRQLEELLPWTTQLWRTVWFAEGIEVLSGSHEVTYAITFTFKEATPEKQKGKLRDKYNWSRASHSLRNLYPRIRENWKKRW